MPRNYTESELRDADLIWLMTLTLGGVPYYFASEQIDIQDGTQALPFNGTLTDVDFTTEFAFGSPDFSLPSAGVAVTFEVDLARLIAQGVDFGSATAELALFRKGSADDFDDRQTVISGGVQEPAYGGLGEAVSFNIEPDFLRNAGMVPSAIQQIEGDAWPNFEPNSEGMVYPVIIGAPGRQGFAGSPIYIAENTGSGNRVGIIAAHACTATSLSLFVIHPDGSKHAVPDQTVQFAVDTNGAPYSYINVPNAHWTDDSTYFAQWDNGGGGVHGTDGSYLTGAGDVLQWFLEQSGIQIDRGRTAAAAALLNFIQLDFYLAERTDCLDFVRNQLMPLLPASLMVSQDGVHPVVWRYDATAEDALIHVTADVDVFRDGQVEYVDNDIYNEIRLNYRHNCRYNKLKKSVTVTGDQTASTSGFIWHSPYSIHSNQRHGRKSLQMETELISSRASAGRVINWLARAYSGKHRVIRYEAPYKLAYLQPGDVITLTDSELHFTEQVLLIQSIDWGDTGLGITLLYIQDLPRDTIPLG
jgi:hypothetical protein